MVAIAIDVGVRYVPAARALAHGRDVSLQAEALLSGDIGHLDRSRLREASALLADAQQDFGPRSTIIQDGWIGAALRRLPISDRQLQATRALRDAGEAATSLGLELVPLLDQVLPDPSGASPPTLVRITSSAAANGPRLARASFELQALSSAVAAVPDGSLAGPLDRGRAVARRDLPKVAAAVGPAISLLQAIPSAVGAGTHTYLVLLENPGEQRPAGGFVGAIGEVVFTDGSLTGSTFQDPTVFDTKPTAIPVPRPLDIHLFHGRPMELSDANWAPDFPTAAADVAHFYATVSGHKTDGVISVDPVALSYVLAITGPVQVAPYRQTITASNALLELNYISNNTRPGDPGKIFLPPFGRTMLDHLVEAPVAQLPNLAGALLRGAREKHISLSFNDPALQRLVDDAHFSGRVTSPLSDALLVDDANLSGTKGDLYVKRSFRLDVKVDPDGQTHDHLVLTYRDPAPTDPLSAKLNTGSGGDYRDYVRVYVPETAQLERMSLTAGGHTTEVTAETIDWEYQRQSIAYWLVVPRGGSAQLSLDYTGPFVDATRGPQTYALLWSKQVNALSWPAEVNVELPGGRRAHWSGPLDTDRQVNAS